MTLLKILKHNGKYFDRTNGKEIELNNEFPSLVAVESNSSSKGASLICMTGQASF
jgi:hypothetical protein